MNTKENVVLDKKENSKNNEDINNNSDEIVKNSKRIRIFGITIWRILVYFIIYSILGFFIETLYEYESFLSSIKDAITVISSSST